MQDKLILGAVVSFASCFVIERGCRLAFPVPVHPVILKRRHQIDVDRFLGESAAPPRRRRAPRGRPAGPRQCRGGAVWGAHPAKPPGSP